MGTGIGHVQFQDYIQAYTTTVDFHSQSEVPVPWELVFLVEHLLEAQVTA